MKILTFDIEDWFHILDNPSTSNQFNWKNFESRIEVGVDKILNLLKSNNLNATFFILGWMAEKHPNIIKKISNLGFEIGSHSHMHQLVYNQSKNSFKNDLIKSIKTIEDCTGVKVKSFRAPGFSITANCKWSFELLAECGIEYDCSVFPTGRSHGGLPEYKFAYPSILSYNGINLKEFPLNTFNLFGYPLVFSGGGYFRLFHHKIIDYMMHKSDYVMTYFHPRDFDPNQPMVPGLSCKRKFKSYVGLRNTEKKLDIMLKKYHFTDLQTASSQINWDDIPIVFL